MSWLTNSVARSRGRSGKPVEKFVRPDVCEVPLSVEARELKKQTRMMAEERTGGAYYAGFFLSMILVGVLATVAPWMPWPILLAIWIGGTVFLGRFAKRRYMAEREIS